MIKMSVGKNIFEIRQQSLMIHNVNYQMNHKCKLKWGEVDKKVYM